MNYKKNKIYIEEKLLINQKNLVQSYKSLKSTIQNKIEDLINFDETSQIIDSDKWIRIFLIGNLRTKKIYLQIEISPKEKFQSLIASLTNQIKSLEYLLKLTDKGFSLEFIREEGIWFGTKELVDEPTEELCKTLEIIKN